MKDENKVKADTRKGKGFIWPAIAGLILLSAAVALYLTRLGGRAQTADVQGLSLQRVVTVSGTPETTKLNVELSAAPDTPTPLPAPTPIPSPTLEPTLKPTIHPQHGDVIGIGTHAGIVMDIQIRLMELEYLSFEQPDDEYSEGTAEAVTSFQRRNGISITGKCDMETYSALFSEEAKSYAVVEGDMGDEVIMIEERLNELGYQSSPADGVYDADTAEAVRRFRGMNKLTDSGEIDADCFESLLGDSPVANFYSVGESGEDIKAHQKRLYELGYLACEPDGKFGTLTSVAVRRFQDNCGLVVDGCLGSTTLEALYSGDAESFSFSNGMRGDDVERIQERLVRYGYMGNATGYYGDVTEDAVKEFQERNGLNDDGKVGPETLAKLNSSNAKKALVTPKPTKTPTEKPVATPKSTPKTTPKATSGGGDDSTAKPTDKATEKPTATPYDGGTTIDYGEGIEAFISIAKSKLGCKYVRGAKGPNTFDCSGFVYWCLNQAGVKQSYMTSKAWRSCSKYKRISSMSELKRGDVLVFTGDGSGSGHVGIYLGGNQMIDASSSKGKVVIRDSISTSYWKTHFYCAYRIWE